MAQVTFDNAMAENNSNSQQQNGVGFFTLKNDGDSAIVRFMEESVNDFDLLTVHDVKVNDRYRKLNCLRTANEPIEKCPGCMANLKVNTKIFIHLLQYEQDENGNIVAKPKIWERSLFYANQLKDLIINYGDLRNCIFRITRNGKAGDMKTTYNIMYCPPQMYPPENYPLQPELFDNYKVLGTVVLDKTASEIQAYLSTGSFPQVQNTQQNNAPVEQSYNQNFNTQPQQNAFVPQQSNTYATPNTNFNSQFSTDQLPWEKPAQPTQQPYGNEPSVQRPVRTY